MSPILQTRQHYSTENTISRKLNYQASGNNLSCAKVEINNDELLQDIIYGLLIVVTGVFFFAILFNFDTTIKREFVFRSMIIIVFLALSALLNKELVIFIIPHQIII